MSIGVRGKLFGLSLVVVSVVVAGSGAYLEWALRTLLVSRVEAELQRHASAARAMLVADPQPLTRARADSLADRLSEATETRITIIAATGHVLGDSQLDLHGIANVENHGERPEVQAALNAGHGRATRHSTTVAAEMLYVAIPYIADSARGVVRASMPLTEVENRILQLRSMLLLAGLLSLVAAALMSAVASHLLSSDFRRLVAYARALAVGARDRLSVSSSDEVGHLAGSINRMAEELERTVEDLARERRRFEIVLAEMSDAVLVLDSEKRIMLCNGAALALLDVKGPAVSRPLEQVVPLPALIELVDEGRTVPASTELSVPGPTERTLLARATPLRATPGIVVVMHDVTEMRRLETVRRDFVANVSHELRTPVSVIRANAETLLGGALAQPDKAHGFVEAILRNAVRLSSIISDLLDLSRIEAGRSELNLRPHPVADIVQRTIEAVEQCGKERRLSLFATTEPGLVVLADAKALEQVLLNLVDNAVKYTHEGGSVQIHAGRDQDRVRIEVRDNGPGIHEKHRHRVFERFYRVDPGRSRDMGGTGLGLAIVKHLVAAMQGKVGLVAAEPHGCIFWLALPAA